MSSKNEGPTSRDLSLKRGRTLWPIEVLKFWKRKIRKRIGFIGSWESCIP